MAPVIQPKPVVPALTPDESQALDQQIDTQIGAATQQTLASYLALGSLLKNMHDGEGYRALHFKTWRDYCESKHEFGLTYMTMITKLGQAGITDLSAYPGITATVLIEYARATDYPEKLTALMQATWNDVKGMTVRDTTAHLRSVVQANWSTYKKRHQGAAEHVHKDWVGRLHKEMAGLTGDDLAGFLAAMQTVLAEQGKH